METYYKGEEEAMPYNNGTLKIKEFRGSSKSNLLWTDRRTMQSWNNFRTLYGRPIYVGFALKDAGKVAMDYKVNIMQEWLLMSHKT